MKIKQEHYKRLFDLMKPYSVQIPKRRKDLQDLKPLQDLKGQKFDIEKRLRWDLSRTQAIIEFINNELGYLDKSHLDTALRKIIKDQEKDEAMLVKIRQVIQFNDYSNIVTGQEGKSFYFEIEKDEERIYTAEGFTELEIKAIEKFLAALLHYN